MSPQDIVIEGTVRPDGLLIFDGPTKLPVGRVQVIVHPLPDLPPGDPFWDTMQSIWAGQKARGFVPRSADEVEAERRETREHREERVQAIGRLQEECRLLQEQRP
jgi:hypothetical protein